MEPLLLPPLVPTPAPPPLATVSAPPPPPPANPEDLHIAQVATAPPPKHAPNHLNHPPYAEMITSAIKSLNEKTGSSKKAIAKFIDSTYSNLPPTHSALLTHHLKRLKENGIILMLKHSYKLPKSSPSTSTSTGAGAGAASGLKRGRGRPPKPKSIIEPDGSVSLSVSGLPRKGRGPGRPPKSMSKPKPKPKLIDRSAGQRPRGRPRKGVSGSVPSGSISVTGSEFGSLAVVVPIYPQDVTMVSKAGRPVGRPKRINVDSSVGGGGIVKPSRVSSGRPVGRPKRGGGAAKPLSVSTGRPVGRPPKVGVVKPVKPKKVSSGRPVGRPPKVGGARGRPPKVGVNAGAVVGVEKPVRVSTGRPVGRPRKGRYLKEKAVELLEESLALGLNQDVSTMLRRETELYHIITGKEYQAIIEEGSQVINDKAATQ